MTGASNLVRTLVIYSLVLPLALIIGYSMATPMDITTWALLAMVLALLCTPLVLKFHRPLLFLFWNTTAVVFFLPGRPQVWILMALVGCFIVILQRTLIHEMRTIRAPSILAPVVFLAVVILITAKMRGGFGLASMGDAVAGGRRYFTMFAGMAGLIAMLASAIPRERALFYTGLFFLGTLMNSIGALVNYISPSFFWIFLFFPVDALPGQGGGPVGRSFGVSLAAMGVFAYLLARFGLKEILFGGRFWRLALLIGMTIITMMGGYRSFFIVLALTVFILAYYEKLFTSKYVGLFILVGILGVALLIPFATKLPLSIQRTISVLPIQVTPEAEENARTSTEWRLKMWETLLPDIPKYFWLGKGLAIEVREFQLTRSLTSGDVDRSFEGSRMAGDFHNGPLTVLINFGVWGAIAWIWFVIAAVVALYRNYLYGDEALRKINALILANFLAKLVNFFFVFGSFHTDLPMFLGTVGLSLALNGGIRHAAPVLQARGQAFQHRKPAVARA